MIGTGLVNIGGDSCVEGRGFESQHHLLDGQFSTFICCKNINICLNFTINLTSFQIVCSCYSANRQAVWPIKKLPKNLFIRKMRNCLRYWQFGQTNCCDRLWKVAQSAIDRPIWSHSSQVYKCPTHLPVCESFLHAWSCQRCICRLHSAWAWSPSARPCSAETAPDAPEWCFRFPAGSHRWDPQGARQARSRSWEVWGQCLLGL